MIPPLPYDKLYRMHRTSLKPEQLRRNAEAMLSLADGKVIQYFSPVLKAWTDCESCDTEFEHRVKPEPVVSTDANDY